MSFIHASMTLRDYRQNSQMESSLQWIVVFGICLLSSTSRSCAKQISFHFLLQRSGTNIDDVCLLPECQNRFSCLLKIGDPYSIKRHAYSIHNFISTQSTSMQEITARTEGWEGAVDAVAGIGLGFFSSSSWPCNSRFCKSHAIPPCCKVSCQDLAPSKALLESASSLNCQALWLPCQLSIPVCQRGSFQVYRGIGTHVCRFVLMSVDFLNL